MDAKNLIEILFKFQNLIAEGSLELTVGSNSSTITRDEIILDVSNPKEIIRLAKVLREGTESDVRKSIKSISDALKLLAEAGEKLSREKKTLIVKYQGRDVVVMGFKAKPGIFDMNNVEIRDKVELMKLISDLLMAL